MSKQKTYALGIDLGGTKTLAAVVDIASGEVVASVRKRTRAERGQDFVSGRILEVATAALSAARLADGDIVAVGVGAAGQIDRKAGVLLHSPNMPLRDLSLGQLLGKRFSRPVMVGSDGEVAAMCEYLYGAGTEYY